VLVGFGGWITLTYPFKLTIDWRKLNDQIAAELLDNARRHDAIDAARSIPRDLP